MTGTNDTLDPAALLAQEDFVRRLASGLLHDAAKVDDVVQEAWLRAIQRPPREPRALRSWLAKVVRNLVADQRSAEIARRRREHAAARAEAIPSPDEIREREALRRRVVERALELAEPYRSTLILRFFENKKPAEIADQLGIPAATVRTRLKRGLDMLRARLDRDSGGDRRSWCLSLIPLARSRLAPAVSAAPVTLTIGAFAMKKSVLWVAASLLLLGSTPLWLPRTFSRAEPPRSFADTPSRSEPGSTGAPAESRREPIAVRAPGAPVSEPVRQIVNANGTPASGVAYWVVPDGHLPESGFTDVPKVPDAVRRTDDHGMWTNDAQGRAVLWCDIPEVARVGFEVGPGTGVVELPAIAELQVGASGLGPREEWLVFADPIWRPTPDAETCFGGHVAETTELAGGARRSVVTSGRRVERRGGDVFRVRVVAGMPIHVYAEASGHELEHDEVVATAPEFVLFRATRTIPTFRVEVVDAGTEAATRLAGKVLLLRPAKSPTWSNDFVLTHGTTTIGYIDLRPGTKYRLLALMADGEVLRKDFVIATRPANVRLERGTGVAPATIEVALPSDAKILIETRDGSFAHGAKVANASFLDEAFAYEVDGKSLRILGAPRGWLTVWALCKDGTIARADNPGAARRTRGRWLESRALPALDLARKQPDDATVYFEVELTGARGKPSWQLLDMFHSNPKTRRRDRPRWTKRACSGVPYRFRMKLPGGADELLVPTGR